MFVYGSRFVSDLKLVCLLCMGETGAQMLMGADTRVEQAYYIFQPANSASTRGD